MALTKKAYAKINWMLDVVGRRADGYHNLVTVMQSVSLCDTLTFERRDDVAGILLDTGGALPADDSNLICRAARAYFKETGKPFGVQVSLEKKIPMQAGMGGGSADAAATLLALNEMEGGRFSLKELCRVAATVGADVPFCVAGGTKICRGIGEKMETVDSCFSPYLVVAMAGEGVSTPQAFRAMDEKFGDFSLPEREAAKRLPAIKSALEQGDVNALSTLLYNRFEDVILPVRPRVEELKQQLLSLGANVALMSGSGPSVFGVFGDAKEAERAAEALCAGGAFATVCQTVSAG